MRPLAPTGREIFFGDDEIIVSKTDLSGVITYANRVFQRVSGYTEAELLGKPHNLIRHPGMPACMFQAVWAALKEKKEAFAYVLNLCRDGSEYWVFAQLTPSFDPAGNHIGYHSNRRVPYSDAIPAVKALYAKLLQVERRYPNKKEGMAASTEVLHEVLAQAGMSYGQFVFSLSKWTHPAAGHPGSMTAGAAMTPATMTQATMTKATMPRVSVTSARMEGAQGRSTEVAA
jgi:PAS domain S-box-containing protein